MQRKILEFTRLLRKSGIRVSTAEAIDAFLALDEIPVSRRDVFRDALRATMVKRGDDVAAFDELFDLFWSGFYDNLRANFEEAAAALSGRGLPLEELLEALRERMAHLEGEVDLSELASALLTMDLAHLERLIQDAAGEVGAQRIENMLQIGFFTRRILEQLGAKGAGQELRELAERLRAAGMGEAQVEALLEHVRNLLEALRASVRAWTERELQRQNYDYVERFRRQTLLEKSFYTLSEEDIRKMREVVARLAQRIRNILSIRRRRQKRGSLDLHQTLRRNMSHGGVPFELVFKERKKEKPKLVILCDISSSVANVSRFMLQFTYSLQDAFTKIRSFVFVSELGEVTPLFRHHEINRAIELALDGGEVINPYTRSNFGFAFHTFWKHYLSAVDNKTTVLILGDARNNYNDPKAWCLRDIHTKAKHVLWLNPESPGAWGFGDSVMDRYLPYVDVAEECRNLRQLSRVIDRLVL